MPSSYARQAHRRDRRRWALPTALVTLVASSVLGLSASPAAADNPAGVDLLTSSTTVHAGDTVSLEVVVHDSDNLTGWIEVASVDWPGGSGTGCSGAGLCAVHVVPTQVGINEVVAHYTVSSPVDGAPDYVGDTSINLTVTNEDPTTVHTSGITPEDTSATIRVATAIHDAHGDTLTVANGTGPAHGGVTLSGTTFTYTPAANYHGADSFTYTVSDPYGGKATGTVSIVVTSVNDPPTPRDDH